MKNIRSVILAVCLGTSGSIAALAQYDNFNEGPSSLASNTTGSYNSAFGTDSLYSNTTGTANAAVGALTLYENTTGIYNTAIGDWTLYYNNGNYNTANGTIALYDNTTGSNNTAQGYAALYANTTGGSNTAIGPYALVTNTTGSNNIAIGGWAGYGLPASSSNNINIGSNGASTDNGAIRIGNPGTQTAFYAAGIRGTKTGASNAVEVMIDSNGQLGTVNSSIRFKEDVHDMAAASDGLMRLRPVTYRYKQAYTDGSKPVDYGLIAEEVAEVYPDLVVKNADGQIQTVQYQKLTPMLLNEVQKEHKLLEQQAETVQQQAETIQQLEKRLVALETMLPSSKAEAQLAEK